MPRYANPDEKAPDYPLLQLIRDVWVFARPFKIKLFFLSMLIASRDLSRLYPVYAFAEVVTLLSKDAPAHESEIIRVLLLLIAAVAWEFVAVYFSRIYSGYAIERMGFDVELKSLQQLFRIDMAWHEKENTGNKLRRISNGTNGVQQIIRLWLNSIITILVTFGGTIYIVAKVNAFTAAIIIVFIAVHYTLSYFLTKPAARSAHAASVQSETVNGLEVQTISNIRTVKVMELAGPLHRRVSDEIDNFYQKVKKRILLFQIRGTALGLWGHSIRIATLIYIIFGVIHGRYEIGFLILFNGYFTTIRDLANNLSDLGQDITIAKFSISRLQALLKTPTTIEDMSGKIAFPQNWQQLDVAHVTFSYGDNVVLQDISFTIRRGEKIGVVGLSGAGKSTLFKLLLKEYENFDGSISFDGTTLQNIKKSDYFKYVAVVLQDTEVFNFSLKDNIVLANDEQKDNNNLLTKSLDIAHVTDFLSKLPEGVESLIGEKGVKLSGGEKQRLGIARAVFKEPQILLLDEATSHLDIESEAKIKDSLHLFFENVTAIVIAHRLTTIKEMDKILVIEEGKLIEQGSFDELYKKKGRFFELWEKQKL